jgi:hypothetical protein
VLRQHQYNALCAARGWKNKLRMLVDDVYPPTSRELHSGVSAPSTGSRERDRYRADTNESGAFLRWSPIRSASIASAPRRTSLTRRRQDTRASAAGRGAQRERAIAAGAGPRAGLSEIMRDVDLFVGVASVGNDPTWQDGGPGGRFRDYWASYSFGELGETARHASRDARAPHPRASRLPASAR